VRAGLESPFPGGAAQAAVSFQHRKRCNRIGGVQVDQRSQGLGALPERRERGMIEILPVGVAVDHRPAEFQVVHAAQQLVSGGQRVLHGQMREARIAIGPLLDFAREEVVGGPRIANGLCGVALSLHARPRQTEHRAYDAGLVHGGKAGLAEIGQARERLLALRRGEVCGGRIPIVHEAWTHEVFFERDFLDHSASASQSAHFRESGSPATRYASL